ncbi:uncharacterized protein B4U80_10746 [Leptotrombidium deliense]|uniref:CUB domain-containing protein n=1 Tax=Leptotrombidium deliense TaxID=299467 RepID=A0A443RXT5_9ACAR|nr:uncharacterized protein B4U80_10746 [Leptotrombidium deliense]
MSHNHTYFVNPLYPAPVTGTNSCALTVYKPFKYRICQLRLDFLEFDINRPLAGNCDSDRMVISGINANAVVPTLCGRNTGQHIYVDVENIQGPITIRMLTSGIGNRRWNIHISQIECTNPSRAPQNCLQYYTGPRGTFQSFNYESTRIPPQITTPAPGNQPTDASYLNGMDYAICFRKEAGFCSQTYINNGTRDDFQIINQERDGTERTPNTQANAGIVKCPSDYILLGGIRFCGMYLNIDGLQRDTIVTNAPVIVRVLFFNDCNIHTNTLHLKVFYFTDSTRGPFIARFVTDSHSTRRGFQLSYHQNPCGSIQPTVAITPAAGG